MSKPKRDMTRVNVYVHTQDLDFVKDVANKLGFTYSDIIRQAVRRYVEQVKEAKAAAKAKRESGVNDPVDI